MRTRVFSDASTSFVGLKDHFEDHISCVEGNNANYVVRNIPPWLHVLTGECRDGIVAIHKDVDSRFLQLYINEYCWKFNRRMFRDSDKESDDLFERLARISMQYTSDIKWRDYPANGEVRTHEGS